MKIAVLYFSPTGNTKSMAEVIAKGCEQVKDVNAKAMSLTEIDETFLKESTCIIIGTPTYYTSMAAEVKKWLDENAARYRFSGKLGGAYATAGYIHGGADLAIQGILTQMLFFGMMIYSSGGSLGEPPIHLGPVAIDNSLNDYISLFQIYGKRMAERAIQVKVWN